MVQKTLATLLAGYLIFAAQTTVATAQSPVVQLNSPVKSDQLRGHIDAYLDSEWNATVPDMLSKLAGAFKPVTSRVPDFGYTKDTVWLRIRVQNTTEKENVWQLYLQENFLQIIKVYLVHEDGRIDKVLEQLPDSTFSSRPVSFPELVAPLDIEPGERATVLINYWSGGSSEVGFSFETPSSFSSIAATRTAKNFIYYGMTILLIVVSILAMMIFRHIVFLAYAAYGASTLLFIMHADGVAFQHLWPNFPTFNGFASLLLGSAIIVFGANYARVFLQTAKLHPVMDRLLLLVIFLTVAMDISALFVDTQILKKLFVLLALFAIVLFTVSGLVAARTRFKQVRFYVFAWAGAVASACIMTLRHWLGVELSQDFQNDSMRVVMVFDATMMGLAIADRYNQLRKSRQDAMRASLTEAQRSLDLNKRFSALEEQYALATEFAKSRDEEIQNTVHDLRQPLHALRLNVKNMLASSAIPADGHAKLDTTFSYLENLISGHLQGSGKQLPGVTSELDQKDTSQLGMQEVLKSIHEMFLPDAGKKGLDLHFEATELEAPIDPLVLMRTVSNLVSNAIKYTSEGEVRLGSRRAGKAVEIYVRDTGSGMSGEEFEITRNRKLRLDRNKAQAEGNGYGLAIVAELAAQNGLGFYIEQEYADGAEMILTVPVA